MVHVLQIHNENENGNSPYSCRGFGGKVSPFGSAYLTRVVNSNSTETSWVVGRSGSLEAEKRPGPGAHNAAPAPSRQQVEHAQATAATTCAPATQILPHHPKPSAPQRAGHRPAVRGRLPRREPVRPAAAGGGGGGGG
eukprot:COSAG06_NODE_3248_length_5619_cov_32.539493_7_plen_137_part_01